MEKRMIRDYEVKQSFNLGRSEIVIAENLKTDNGMCYMIADYHVNELFARYENIAVSDTYMEILEEFQERVQKRVGELKQEQSKITVPLDVITADMCDKNDYSKSIDGKIIAIRPDVLKPEYRKQTAQLMLVTGGNGARGNARGTAVFCTNLYTGEHSRYERMDVQGVVKPECVPEWALKKLTDIQKNKRRKEKER